MKTGNTGCTVPCIAIQAGASMEPGHEDREYRPAEVRYSEDLPASMEPGHEDREYSFPCFSRVAKVEPQWSPVMKTGNTALAPTDAPVATRASMEPGHEDREYPAKPRTV